MKKINRNRDVKTLRVKGERRPVGVRVGRGGLYEAVYHDPWDGCDMYGESAWGGDGCAECDLSDVCDAGGKLYEICETSMKCFGFAPIKFKLVDRLPELTRKESLLYWRAFFTGKPAARPKKWKAADEYFDRLINEIE